MSEYFSVCWAPSSDASHSAKLEQGAPDIARLLTQQGQLENLPILRWDWRSHDSPPPDMIAAVEGARLVSDRFRRALDEHVTEVDRIQWLEAEVRTPRHGDALAWVAHFPAIPDLLDREKSTFGPSGLPIHAVLSASKLESHAVTVKSQRSLDFILARRVVDGLAEAGCEGLRIARVGVA